MITQLCRQGLVKNATAMCLRSIHKTAVNETFWEREKKSGYAKKYPLIPSKSMILDGLQELKSEIKLWSEEVKEKFETDPILVFRPGETDIAWQFTDKTDFDKWVVTADSDHNQGTSKAEFERSAAGYALFSGNLSVDMPRDGRIKKSGYCNIRSQRARKSFKRETYLDWSVYNTLVLKVRGDGRPYLINITCEGYFDITWNDVYHYVLHTRGGPHWQIMKIPFSKFFLASKGRVQDKQFPIPLNKVTNLGLSCSARGGFEGNFSLEIDYVGLEFDPNHTEEFAYEMYKQDKYIVNT